METGAAVYQRGVANYVALSASQSLETLKPYLRSAQDSLVYHVLGEELTALATAYHADASALSPARLALLPLVQEAVANLGYVEYLPIGNVNIGDHGITVGSSPTQAPASQWRVKDLRNQFTQAGYRALENIVLLLWANPSNYPTWNADTAVKLRYREHFVNHTSEFSKWWDIGSGFDLLQRLRPSLRRAEQLHLRQTLGDTFFDELLAAWKGGSPSTEQRTLIETYLQPALVNLTIADGLGKINADLTARGLLEYRVGAAGDNVELRGPAPDNMLNSQARSAHYDGTSWLQRAVEYLNANASDFATWQASDKYIDPTIEVAEDDYTNRLDNSGPTFML